MLHSDDCCCYDSSSLVRKKIALEGRSTRMGRGEGGVNVVSEYFKVLNNVLLQTVTALLNLLIAN